MRTGVKDRNGRRKSASSRRWLHIEATSMLLRSRFRVFVGIGEGSEPLLPLLLLHLREALRLSVEFFQISSVNLQQMFETWHKIVVGGDGVQLSVIDGRCKPLVVFSFAAPGLF